MTWELPPPTFAPGRITKKVYVFLCNLPIDKIIVLMYNYIVIKKEKEKIKMKIIQEKLILSSDELNTLIKASDILNNIANAIDRAISVNWSIWDDDEIWGAVEIIDSFTNKTH